MLQQYKMKSYYNQNISEQVHYTFWLKSASI